MVEVTDGGSKGWHGPNNHMLDWPSLAWAWEFLRRNPPLWQKWREAQPDLEVVQAGQRPHVIRAKSDANLAPFPCLLVSSPDADAQEATVAWNPDNSPYVLRAVALPTRSVEGAAPFTLSDMALQTTVVLTPDHGQHVVIRDGVRALQLHVFGADVLDPVALLVDTACDSHIVEYQDVSLRCLRDLRRSGCLSGQHFPPSPRAQGYAMKLKALDLSLSGARQREIATALFGEGIASNWTTDENLRHRVRYYVSCGHALMNRGYRMLLTELQPSRRSR